MKQLVIFFSCLLVGCISFSQTTYFDNQRGNFRVANAIKTKEDTLKKLQYDLFYIKNRSVYLDFSIILKTIATVFGKGGM